MISITAPEGGQYAAAELERFLRQCLDEPVAIGPVDGPDRRCVLSVDPRQTHELAIHHSPTLTRIIGRSESAMLHGVYCFLEHLGYVFTVRGPIAPDAKVAWPEPFVLEHTPVLARRGIRQHINFPMDISCCPLEDALEYVRNLGRLKLNALMFHLYAGQGWLRFDRDGYSGGTDPRATLYYGERHEVCRDPAVRARSANRATWFIPEFESQYQSPDQHELLRGWLGRLMQCARTCGMSVGVSVEALSPAHDKRLEAMGGQGGLERYARATAITALAALEAYPQADQVEIISGENESNWPAPASPAQTVRELGQELGVPAGKLPGIPTGADSGQPAGADAEPSHPPIDAADSTEPLVAKLVMGAVRSLQVADRAIELMRSDPVAQRVLGDRLVTRGIYMTNDRAWGHLRPFVRRLVPRNAAFATMAAHSSRRTAKALATARLPADLLARTRIYAWCEFDGLMYLTQNECEGLHRCIQQARREDAVQPASVLGNHWRVAESELSIGYLAEGSFTGRSPGEFYQHFLGRCMGQTAAGELARAMVELDEATAFAVEHLFNLGFCYLGCWQFRHISRWAPRDLEKYRRMLQAVQQRIEAAMPQVTRPAGMERCRLLANRLAASQVHCQVIAQLQAMNGLVDWAAGTLPQDRRAAFVAHARAARELAATYVARCAAMLADRTSEGTLVSYEHVMYGLLDKVLKEFVGQEAMAQIGTDPDAPPAPLNLS